MTADSDAFNGAALAQFERSGVEGRVNNKAEKEWVVQKFGGTCVGKFASKIAEDIVRPGLRNNKIAVVCSARSTGKKVEGTTSRLLEIYGILQAANSTKDPNSAHYQTLVHEYERLVCLIREDHLNAARLEIKDEQIQESLMKDIEAECREIYDFRIAARRWHLEINERCKDRMISFGEKLSCRFIVAILKDRGVEAEYIDLADVIHFKSCKSRSHVFYKEMTIILREKVLGCRDRVPVLTGYFGPVPGGLMDGEIGRGYTDLCASLVAVGIKAIELQIWKEVDGIFTADPSKVPTARLLPTITPSEAAELTFYGAEVIHHLTMDQVINASPPIQIRIKNVKNPSGSGTIVLPDKKFCGGHLAHVRSPSANNPRRIPKRPTAVTIKDKITVINVHSNKRSNSYDFFAKVFSILDKQRMSVDLISTSEVHVSMAIHSASTSGNDFPKVSRELEEFGEVSILDNMAILSLVGAEMKNMIGVAGRMFSTLGENNINIEMISQGASEINISCVISAFEAARAMTVLHTSLFTFLE
ncbi:Bgt-738 [Blumeria graminis f. sp. tritici]|uniref:Aspartokinase n=3 Tax=Blumeria graminis TaxID=34373 RepID=A0A9X9MFW4_BLUGR|nr:Aspartate kinase [Blumeria graminis f. sp. tritici 96224]VDB85900.1 Bgt-738 [Blumeria graminis f. sp. tritici]